MAQKTRPSIALPPKTQAALENAVNQQRMIQAQIDAIVMTARDLLEVPEDYVLQSLSVGFEPPAPAPQPEATE